jgi:transcriptional regulator with XRE-family HTH domain
MCGVPKSMILDPKIVGQRIELLRTARNLTQREFATELQMSQSAVSQYEAGARLPSTRALQRIAMFLRVPISELIGPSNGPEHEKDRDFLVRVLSEKLKTMPKEQLLLLGSIIDSFVWADPRGFQPHPRQHTQIPPRPQIFEA